MNTRQTKLSDDEYPLVPVSNGREVPLLTLVDQLTDGRLQIPPHQRTARQWDSRKKSSFIRRIQDGRQCIGCILTYQIGGRGIVYLNDGLQRLSTAREYLDNPLQYGDSIEKARDRLNCYSMVIQHRHYRNHDEALLDFQEINQGSHLTAFQFARGVLTYMKDYELYWKPFFEDLHLVLTRQPVLLAKQRGGTTQESRDAYKRNDYALFYRFATGEKSLIRYWSGRKKLSASDVEDKSVLEWKLRIWCESTGIDIARKLLKRFEVMVTEETQLIMTLWKKEEHQGKGIATLLYRGLLDIGIWRRNNDLPYDKWEDFVKKVLANSQGSGLLTDPNDRRRRPRFSQDSPNSLKSFCDAVGSDLYLGKGAARKETIPGILPGLDVSHVKPKSIYGDGDVFPEPAGRNRARGAQIVNPDDVVL